MKALSISLLALTLIAVLAVPTTAAAAVNRDAEALRQAVSELWQAKHAARPAQAAQIARANKSMAKCRSTGPGWKRLRKLKDGAQRRLYAGGARILWNDLRELAEERARLQTLRGAMGRYVNRIEHAGITDPVLVAGVAAQRRRLAVQETLVPLGSCKTFEARMRKVRSVRRRGRAQAHFDAAAGAVYAGLARYVEKKRTVAERQYENQLDASNERLVALGLKEGDANGFLYALSLLR